MFADHHRAAGATVAADGIPLTYSTVSDEYQAAQNGAVLFDRSHEGRVRLTGADALALLQRTSTNDVLKLTVGGGCATVFTSPIGRIIDRVEVWHRGDDVWLLAGPGRGEAVRAYVQQNIFFRDKVTAHNPTNETAQFSLHGRTAESLAEALVAGASALPLFHTLEGTIGSVTVTLGRAKPLIGAHFRLICAASDAPTLWDALLATGQTFGLHPAGSLTYNTLRIEAGIPAAGRELTGDYIPLEVGLWDEVSFAKGCYTGQEIIARMESRGKLAKTLVKLGLSAALDAPADVLLDGKRVGVLTSSVTTPTGEHVGIGFIKPEVLDSSDAFSIGDGMVSARVRS